MDVWNCSLKSFTLHLMGGGRWHDLYKFKARSKSLKGRIFWENQQMGHQNWTLGGSSLPKWAATCQLNSASSIISDCCSVKILITSCPARRCSGIRAPLNFVASLLLAPLNFVASLLLAPLNLVASFLCSAHLLNFVASLWSAQLPRLPIYRSTHRKPHWETLFSVELLLSWKTKGRFRMVRHKRSAPGYSLSWRQPSQFLRSISFSLPCGDVLLLHAVCDTQSFNPCRWPAALLYWRPSVQTSFIVTSSRNFWTIGIVSTEKGKDFFSTLRELPASKDMFVVLTAYAGSLTNDRYARTVGFWNYSSRQILEIPTNRPTKVCEKAVRFLEKLTCSKWSCSSVGFLRGSVWFLLWSNVMTFAGNRVNDRDREHGRKGKDLF